MTQPPLSALTAALITALLLTTPTLSADEPSQTRDDSFASAEREPTYTGDAVPQVSIDEHHCNFHTADGRYKPFADLLRSDGLQVAPLDAPFTAESLGGTDVLVIANAISEQQCEEWKLPTASAFTDDEIAAVSAWVESGGSLLLIADHMPIPGSNAKLARAFGLIFIDGYVRPDEGRWITFERSAGTLTDHPVTQGLAENESIDYVTTFTGQGFSSVDDAVVPLMILPAGTTNHLPIEAGEFDETTPQFSAEGLLQGALIAHGQGRVAVFGEAAMFSAQEIQRNGQTFRFGMNAEGAEQNGQFLLNVVHWLTGLLDP